MNVMPAAGQFAAPSRAAEEPDSDANRRHRAIIEREQAVLASCLTSGAIAQQAIALLVPADFAEPIHQAVFGALTELVSAGRSAASVDGIVQQLGNSALYEGLSLYDYLKRLVSARILDGSLLIDWRDAVDAMREASARRALSEAGVLLANGQGLSVDLAADAINRISEVVARMSRSRGTTYDADAAAAAALALLDAERSSPSTGLRALDGMIGGWPRGQLSVVAARPGMGKSAFLTSTAWRMAKKGQPVLVYSLEMQREQIGARLLTDIAYRADDEPIAYEAILRQEPVSAPNRSRLVTARKQLSDLPLRVEERRSLTPTDIMGATRRYMTELDRRGTKLAVVMVDHIGLVRPSSRYAGNRERELAEITAALATMAKELDLAVVALCQLNRAVEGRENKRPMLADLRGSGAIEEDASIVAFLYREAYYLAMGQEGPSADGEALALSAGIDSLLEVIVAKNRNGRVGSVPLWIDIAANAIRSLRPK